ncbi:glycosyltransferase [Wenyingzhuangia sp. IMCC45533]
MRVVQVIDQLQVGGAERVFVDLTNILHINKYDVNVICLLNQSLLDKELCSGIKISYLGRKNKFNIYSLLKLHKWLKQYDIVHVHCRQVMRYVGLLNFVPLLKKHRIVFHDHYGRIDTDQTIDNILGYILRDVKAYIGVSRTLLDWYNGMYVNAKSYVLSNIIRLPGVDTNARDETVSNKDIVMIGNFREQKHYEFALKVLQKLPKEYTLTIFGKVVNQGYYLKIKKEIEDLNLTSRVIVKTDVDNASAFIGSYGLALHTASSETGPLVAIEYLGNRVPFVIFNTGQVTNQIRNELNHFIVNDFNVETWVGAIENLVKNKLSDREVMKRVFDEKFSEKEYLKKIIHIYQEIIS